MHWVNQPDMIIADEPTGSLDSQSQEKVLEVFKNLAQTGKTVLIVTHNPEVAEYADVIIKNEGWLKWRTKTT